MNIIYLTLILLWISIWISYIVISVNSEKMYYKYKKFFLKKDRPMLFHIELIISVLWTAAGYTFLGFFLYRNL